MHCEQLNCTCFTWLQFSHYSICVFYDILDHSFFHRLCLKIPFLEKKSAISITDCQFFNYLLRPHQFYSQRGICQMSCRSRAYVLILWTYKTHDRKNKYYHFISFGSFCHLVFPPLFCCIVETVVCTFQI